MKVFDLPDDLPAPEPNYKNYDMKLELAKEAEHKERLKKWLIEAGYNGPLTGEIFSTPRGDGYANYMFADKGKHSALVLLPYGDAWDDPNVRFIPRSEIIRRIKIRKSRPQLPPMELKQ